MSKDLNLKVEDLEDRLDCQHKVAEAAGAQIKEYKQEISELTNSLKQQKNTNKVMYEEITNLESQLFDYYDEHDRLKNSFSILKNEYRKTQLKLKIAEQHYNSDLKRNSEEKDKKIDELLRENQSLSDKNSNLKHSNERYKKRLSISFLDRLEFR